MLLALSEIHNVKTLQKKKKKKAKQNKKKNVQFSDKSQDSPKTPGIHV